MMADAFPMNPNGESENTLRYRQQKRQGRNPLKRYGIRIIDYFYELNIENNPMNSSRNNDFLNSTIVIDAKEEIALTLSGKKSNLNRKDLIEYYGIQRLGLSELFINKLLEKIKSVYPEWINKINNCFLSQPMKDKYLDLLEIRIKKINLIN